jgi:hypothetical protein
MLTAWSSADRLTAIAARIECFLRAAPKGGTFCFSTAPWAARHGRFEEPSSVADLKFLQWLARV